MKRNLILLSIAACAVGLLWHRAAVWQRLTLGLGWCDDVFDTIVHPERYYEVDDYYC